MTAARREEIDSLRELRLFRGMAEENFETLLQPAFLQRFPSHVILIRQGDAADFLHIVLDGLLEHFAVHDQREYGLFLTGPGDVFPLASVVGERPCIASVRVVEPSQVLMVPTGVFRAVFSRDLAFAQAAALELAATCRQTTKELASQKMRPSSERLANWILRQMAEGGHGGTLTLRIDKRTLASLIGTTPENLSRNFGILSGHGVSVRGRQIVVEDAAALTAFATPHPLMDDPAA
jgi:CRP/FNR family transcriptional activator FtrB